MTTYVCKLCGLEIGAPAGSTVWCFGGRFDTALKKHKAVTMVVK